MVVNQELLKQAGPLIALGDPIKKIDAGNHSLQIGWRALSTGVGDVNIDQMFLAAHRIQKAALALRAALKVVDKDLEIPKGPTPKDDLPI